MQLRSMGMYAQLWFRKPLLYPSELQGRSVMHCGQFHYRRFGLGSGRASSGKTWFES